MAPKAAAKPKKAPSPIPEPEDRAIAPDLTTVAADLQATDPETQQQALTRLFAIKEYPGAKVFCASYSPPARPVQSHRMRDLCVRCR